MTDDLDRIWRRESATSSRQEGETMLNAVVERTRAFDRKVAARNRREWGACAFVFVTFAFLAWAAHSPLEMAGNAIVALSALWIAYFLRRHGGKPAAADPSMDLLTYRASLRAQYDHQIRLLRSVRYWYLLPMYTGLAVAAVGEALRRNSEGRSLLAPALVFGFCTMFFVAVAYWNEGIGVRRLEEKRREIED